MSRQKDECHPERTREGSILDCRCQILRGYAQDDIHGTVEAATTCYIAFGSNLGSRRANIESAIDKLRSTPGVEVTKVSSLMENPAVGGPTGSPTFLNSAAELVTSLLPQQLLNRLLEIERELGRTRRQKWEPRLIDLDLLLYGQEIVQTDKLTIPHPLMHERDFVLKPLREIAPNAIHPVLNKRVSELL